MFALPVLAVPSLAATQLRFADPIDGAPPAAPLDAVIRSLIFSELSLNGLGPLADGAAFTWAETDLNDDATPELFVRLLDAPAFCDAAGCRTLVYAKTQSGYVKIGDFFAEYITIADTKTARVRDLVLGYADRKATATIQYSGRFYAAAAKTSNARTQATKTQ